MNSTLETILNRRSVRTYADRPLTDSEKELIFTAAMRAPTAGNMMLYSIIEVEHQAMKDKLAETCDHQPFIAKAPYVLIFLADYQRWFDVFRYSQVEKRCQELDCPFRKPQTGDLMLACCDAVIAAQNAVIAAESLGIGSCYIGDILENCELHREMFCLPEYVFPIALLCFGYPASDHPSHSQARRFDREFIVHKNAYLRLEQDQIRKMMQPLEERFSAAPVVSSVAENAGQGFYFRKFIADFSLEMTRSVREYLKSWAD
jgi:FMN reductase (NADPH)/FMN reductase [NAD(P)H]